MRITNLTNEKILCLVDESPRTIDYGKSIEVETFAILKIMHKYASYSTTEMENSKLLKFLSLLDDPFKLRREYHIVIDIEVDNRVYNPQELIITAHTNCVDIETRTYYEYFLVQCDGDRFLPSCIWVSGSDNIKREFQENNKKLVRWNAIWDVLIEPVLLEFIGYFVVYQLLSVWVGALARYIVFFIIALNILIELVVLCFRVNDKRINLFVSYLENSVIWGNCYNNSLNE